MKRGPKNSTIRQKKAIKILLEKGGSVGSAMRQAGYSTATAKNPDHLTESKAYIKHLEAAGITDEMLSTKQAMLLAAAHIETLRFDSITKNKVTTIGANGRKLKKSKIVTEFSAVADEKIKEIIESVPGHKLIYIQTGATYKIAHFQVPESVVQSKQIEMSLKVKGHMMPEIIPVHHVMTDDERAVFASIFQKNRPK